ncbi:MAG TPA: hypothetical protein VKD90_25415 [Gemmataceae bacterium]|nr:hypothetical protein [Gemmataceae bacterium]
MRHRSFPLKLAVATLALAGLVTPATAEDRPHKWHGTGHFVSETGFVAKGFATHLGTYDEVGAITAMTPTEVPGVFAIEGWAIHTAANGDQLYEVFSGRLNFLTGAVTASIRFVGGTGRFTDASGSATLSAQILPDGSIDIAGEGTIDY